MKNNYENDLLQIRVKSEIKKNLGVVSASTHTLIISHIHIVYFHTHAYTHRHTGCIGIYFGNKSTSNFIGFSSSISLPGDLANGLNVQSNPVSDTIESGALVQQVLNIECKNVFFEVKFT